jgi:cysteine-S-conjugate beta-lyase
MTFANPVGRVWTKDELLQYLQQNLNFLTDYIETNIKELKVIGPEGTYLVWIDCRGLGVDAIALERLMQ